MKHKLFKRWVAMLLVLAMCVSCVPAVVFAEEGEEETRSPIGTEEQTLEDASAQLGEYTPPAADPEQETEPPAEEPAPETEAPAEATEAPETEASEAEPVRSVTPPQPVGAGTPNEGRAHAGDVTLSVPGGKTYILIGTRQQLQALDYYPEFISAGSLSENSDALTEAQRYDVMGPIWRLDEVKAGGIGQDWVVNNAELVYPGDADLVEGVVINSNGDTKDFSGYTLYGVNGKIVGPNAGNDENHKLGDSNTDSNWGTDYRTRYVGGTLTQYDENVRSYNYGKYSPRGDYVVFRDIDLNNEPWTPLMFYGTMLGVKGDTLNESGLGQGNQTLEKAVQAILSSRRSADYANPIADGGLNLRQPTISNIAVSTSGELYTTKYLGVGFFASVTSNRPGSEFSFTPIRAEVRNLMLDSVTVNNGFTGIHVEQTLVNLLTDGLGKLVGALLDVLLPILLAGSTTQYTNFTQSLSDLLAARQRDITNLAAGGFTGRIDGDVLIENCDLNDVSVTSGYGYTGGFVGYSTGCEQYLPVTGPLLRILEGVLNLIPGLGLGDLITIVSHLLHLNYLIPMDYLNPVVNDCEIRHLSGNIGPAQADLENADWGYTMNAGSLTADHGDVRFNGGFVGCKIATQMVNCSIEDSSYSVWAKEYAGGFAGCARDAVIEELLTGLGIDLIENANVNLESVQVRCNILNSDVTVKGQNYLGGFNGAMANAFCVNNEVKCPGKSLKVEGTGNGVGGFAGIATLGWAMNLGNEDDPTGEDLLSTVTHLLGTLLGGDFDASLLDLVGVGQSYILGLQFDWSKANGEGEEIEVTGANCVGGLVGQADALIMSGVTTDYLDEISYFAHGDLNAWDAFPDMPVQTVFTVTYKLMTGASMSGGTSDTVGPNSYELTLPSATAPAGYNFEGWVTGNYDHADARPDKVYAAGSTLLVTRDLTLKGLFSKEGAEAYELVVQEPQENDDWDGDYVISYLTTGSDMHVLAGMANNAEYENNANGTKTLADAGIAVNEEYRNFLTGVTDNYVFTINQFGSTGLFKNCTIKNKGLDTYLGLDIKGTTLGGDRRTTLYAESSSASAKINWQLAIRTEIDDSDPIKDYFAASFDSQSAALGDEYLAYHTDGYFTYAVFGSANPSVRNIYLWRKSKLPTTYTTVAVGQELTADDLEISDVEAYVGHYKHVNAKGLKEITGVKYVGGLVGLADTASVSSLLGDVAGVGDFRKFDFSEIYAVGSLTDGLTVTGSDYYVGGGIGLALGGDIHPLITGYTGTGNDRKPVYDANGYGIKLDELKQAEGLNCVGGFAGCVGPGEVLGTGGLNVQLLGLSLIKANNLLSLGQGLETKLYSVTVTGVSAGYTVEETGTVAENGLATYCAGGFFGRSNSTVANDCHAVDLQWVKANEVDGRAGGFIGVSEVGGLASMDNAEGKEIKSLLQADGLLDAVGYLIPEYTLVDTSYVDGGYVQAACAGGFAADFQSGTVDNSAKAEGNWYGVYNIDHVTGTYYAGGFAGKLYSGALAQAGGGISILGDLGLNIDITDLLDLVEAYVPRVIKAGVSSETEFTDEEDFVKSFIVTVTDADPDDKNSGAAGGFVGYGSGAQVSYSDVRQLRHTDVEPPAELDGKNGDSYYDNRSEYAVTGTRYAGGYAGFLDIGSSASLGKGLNVLNSISADDVLGALNVVISTVEHSEVYGAPGGFAVKASWTAENSAGGSSGGAKGPTRAAEDEITVYVVDQTNSPNFYAYIFNSSTQTNDGYNWHGHELTSLGKDREGNNIYSFAVDPTLYNRVIFNNGNAGQYSSKNEDDVCLKLDEATMLNGVLPCYNNSSWVVYANGADIWPEAEAQEGCRGSYWHYVSVTGNEEYVETVTGSKQHDFSVWMPVDGVNKHERVCLSCGFAEEEDCTIVNDYCTVCGRRDAELPASITEYPGLVGRAGGFVGWLRGSHIQDSHSWNFSYIIGQIAAGGYAGEMEPGSVADALGETSILHGLASVSGSLLSIAKDFVPTVRNSVTTSIPCGGAVRANALSDSEVQRGMAGGYVGHNCGGQIWGNNDDPWKEETDPADEDHKYNGPKSECAAIRILSVYGAEYAGGFTGLMDPGSTAGTGNISLLFDLVKLNGLLDALKISYPTEENTAVYGPLAQMDYETWNKWVNYIGVYGGYGMSMEHVESQAALDAILGDYRYGYHVTAGRDEFVNDARTAYAGCAGGYVGAMRSGTITNGQAHDCKQVVAMRNAGGFAGEMKTGSVANLGQAEALGLELNLSRLLPKALEVFVPVVKSSSVHGYQNGMTVAASGESDDGCGSAGGYAGSARGAQIWGEPTAVTGENQAQTLTVGEKGCNVYNLKKVQGTRYVGGYIGSLVSGTVAEAGTNVSDADSPLQNLLDDVIESGSDNVSNLLGLASATVSTVRYASVDVADPAWGFTVGGLDGKVPLCAGGFIGTMEGAILGNNGKTVTETEGEEGEDDTYTVNDPVNITATNLIVNHLRGVQAQYYAGGFVGVANVGGAASVAGNGASILKLINLDQISALDIFRPYIFNSKVTGVDEGFTVSTMGEEKSGVMCSSRYSGCSGGFAGAVLDGTVKNCQVEDLSQVDALNYAGGFVGHSGKSGLADVDGTQISQLAALNAGVGDSFGTYIKKSSVSGVDHGYTVNAAGGHETVAGGFVGYADLAKIGVKHLIDGDEAESSLACAAENLKFVKSEQIAGGFVGKTTKGYLVELQASSPVVALLLNVVNVLVRALYLPEAERANFLNLNLAGLVGVQLLNEGNLLGVNLLGIRITVALGTKEDEGGATDVAKITIGDSYIELPCNENGLLDLEHSNLTIRLIPLFYTNLKNCTVSAADTAKGYDIFGGGADQENDGTHRNGYAGGFAGFNHLGKIEGCAAVNCDVVRGTPAKLTETATVSVQKVGPFTGYYYDDSIYNANEQTAKETGDTFNTIQHSQENPPSSYFESDAKVKLLEDTPLPPNLQSLVPETAEMQNPCLNCVDLTLHKVWDDMDGTLGLRADAEHPVTVTFSVWKLVNGDKDNPVKVGDYTLSAADANPFTENVWTKVIRGLPATNGSAEGIQFDDPDFERYTYYVTEANVSGYVAGTAYADANVENKLSFYTDKDGGYVAKIVNQFCTDQSVVVDFGLPVNISVIDYLKAKYEYPVSGLELAGILPLNDLQKVSRYDTKDAENNELLAAALDVVNQDGVPTPTAPVNSVQPQYGSFSVPAKENGAAVTKLRYVPGSMMFDKPIQVVAALQGPDGGYYYTKVTVVPATMIYFEDDFISFSSEWTEVGTAADGEQDEDRPGADQLDLNSIYGYDSQYANSSTYSLDSARLVTVTKGMTPSASFTFTGTAFDILAVTDKTTGFMTVEVFRGTTTDVQNRVRYWAVDTFYGCTREENGYIRYLCVWDEKELKWRVAKTAFPEMTDAEALAKVGTTEDGCVVKNDYPTDLATNHSSFIVYKKNYVWVTNGSSNTVYQVPVISTRNGDEPLPYGTYTVVLKPQYASFFDHDTSDASYKVYLDGVRIYGPAENLDAEYYLQDHEGWPQFIEMRKLLLGQEGFGQTQDGEEQSIVYIDGGITVSDISEFAQYGPNNEIYLDPGQAIAFRLEKGNSAKVDQIHVSMKRVFSGEAKISFTSGTDEAPRSTELTLNTASECYYDLSSVIQWDEGSNQTDLIIISNSGESGTVSLRNLKISYKEAVANENDLVHVVKSTPNTAMEALRLLRRSATLPIVLDEDPAFLGASISLESDFSLHFYIPAAFLADKTNPYVVFTKQTADGPVVICQYDYAEETVGEKLCRRYSFPNLSAAEMGTEVTARLFYNTEGADHMSHALSYSVRQYAMNMLEKTDDAALKTLLVDMLNYGAEAQKYFGVNESSLANSGLTEAQQLYATEAEPALENHKSMLRREDARVWFEGCSLSLESSVTLNYYLDLSTCGIPANELALELSWLADDGSVKTDRIDGTAFLARQLGNRTLYAAVLDELNAAQMRTIVSAAVIRKEDQMQVSDTMCYSIESYAQSKMKNDPALAVLILAMMKYGDAAESYFSNH